MPEHTIEKKKKKNQAIKLEFNKKKGVFYTKICQNEIKKDEIKYIKEKEALNKRSYEQKKARQLPTFPLDQQYHRH